MRLTLFFSEVSMFYTNIYPDLLHRLQLRSLGGEPTCDVGQDRYPWYWYHVR